MSTTIKKYNRSPDVPSLELTGERTLPDVAKENYWFQRHLVVYQWIAKRCNDLNVVDMACGEGYGSDEIAKSAKRVIGVDANPEAYEHALKKYVRSNLSFERKLVEEFSGNAAYDAIVFLQTIEHLQDPGRALCHFGELLTPSGVCYITTPNRLTLAPPGADKSDNPWHVREYVADQFTELLEEQFQHVELYGVFHARKLRLHELALKAGWDKVHRRLGLSSRFYGWFIPSISSEDFHIGHGDLDRALDFLAVCRT